VITWEAKKEQIFEMPTGGAAIMRKGPNLLKLARKVNWRGRRRSGVSRGRLPRRVRWRFVYGLPGHWGGSTSGRGRKHRDLCLNDFGTG
jgi:hypothetical protein